MTALAPISITESSRLEKLEVVIERGLFNFVEVGEALMEIRDGKLYREKYGTFEDYCHEKWGMTQQYATQLCRSAKVAIMLESETTVSVSSERQVRPLTQLDSPIDQRAAFTQAQEAAAAEGKPLTARHVEAAVEQIKPKPKRNGSAPPPHAPGTITDAELNEGDKGDPVWRCAFAFRECDDRQKFKALGQIIDDMDAETQVLAGALILSVYSPAQIVALCKQVDLGTLVETSRAKL